MKKALFFAAACFVTLLILFFITDPNKVPSFVLVLPFLLLFLVIFLLISHILEKKGLPDRKRLKIAALGAGMPLVLLVLQSIGQLTVKDVLVLSVLFVLSYFYIVRNNLPS